MIKGTRWLLLKNNDNLKDDLNERERLEMALNINKPLAIAYYLKEDLKQLWQQSCKENAKKFLGKWVAKAFASGINMLHKFANSLLAHRSGILSWYDYHISTGPLEGLNNKIKLVKRQAYGYRDLEFFELKILSLHKSKYVII